MRSVADAMTGLEASLAAETSRYVAVRSSLCSAQCRAPLLRFVVDLWQTCSTRVRTWTRVRTLSPFLLDLGFGSKDSDLDLDLKAMDLDLDLEVL